MRPVTAATLLLVILSAAVWGKADDAPAARSADAAALAEAINAFGVDLYARTAGAGDGNLLLSPLSLHAALAMARTGAGGRTADEMAKVLHLRLPKDRTGRAYGAMLKALTEGGAAGEGEEARPYALYFANAVWTQKGMKAEEAFKAGLRSSYLASLFETDFARPDAARATINDWVGGFTEHKIKELVSPGVLTPQTRMVLASALYFKSAWQCSFPKSATRDAPFRVRVDKTVSVPMMSEVAARRYMETADLQACSLAYSDGRLAMVVLLPKKADGLGVLEKSLSAEALAGWLAKLEVAEVAVTLPRFQITCPMRAAQALQALGMKEAFTDAADFSGIAKERYGLALTDVVHEAVITVDENGTEAAAATAGGEEGGENAKTFTADHPFFFLIRENMTGAILFMGRVVNPG